MSDQFDDLVGWADAAMVVVTAATDTERAGCLVGFHSQCSIDPPRYALWLSTANHTYRVALQATHLGVHFLSTDDHDVAELFGGLTDDDPAVGHADKLSRIAHRIGAFGVPLLDGCARRVVVRRVSIEDSGGDHVCFVTEPVEVDNSPPSSASPLRLSDVDDVTPGHPSGR